MSDILERLKHFDDAEKLHGIQSTIDDVQFLIDKAAGEIRTLRKRVEELEKDKRMREMVDQALVGAKLEPRSKLRSTTIGTRSPTSRSTRRGSFITKIAIRECIAIWTMISFFKT